jgi:hypothetical protein
MPTGLELEKIQRSISQTMADAIGDAYRGISQSASMVPDSAREAEAPRAPGAGSVPLGPPPGVEHVDAIAAAFEQRERLEDLLKRRALVRELVDQPEPVKK